MTKAKLRTVSGGRLFIIDGIDGSGKTTQIKLAKQALQQESWQVEDFRFLGSSPIGEELRRLMFSHLDRPPESDLHMALAIHASVAELVKTARRRGSLILLDRGPLSLIAYDFYGPNYNLKQSLKYFKEVTAKFKPDLTIFLKCPIDIALKRSRREVRADYFGNQPDSYFKRVNQGYLVGAGAIRGNYAEIDANQSINRTSQLIIEKIKAHLDP